MNVIQEYCSICTQNAIDDINQYLDIPISDRFSELQQYRYIYTAACPFDTSATSNRFSTVTSTHFWKFLLNPLLVFINTRRHGL